MLPLLITTRPKMADRTNIGGTLVILAPDRLDLAMWAHTYSCRRGLRTEGLVDTPRVLNEMVDTQPDVSFYWVTRVRVILNF